MIYIAAPYSHIDVGVREARAFHTTRYATRLITEGRACISPLTYGQAIVNQNPFIQHDYRTWQMINDRLLRACDSIHILQLDGWFESEGVRHERNLAVMLYLHVEYIRYEDI
jgi:hypothetical protein